MLLFTKLSFKHTDMKKILIALDSEKPDQHSINFGCYLARLTGSGLTGIFLEDLSGEGNAGVKFAYGSVYVETIGDDQSPETAFRLKTVEAHIREFREMCTAQDIRCQVHRDQGVPQAELIEESRYADLIISSPALLATSALEIPAGLVKTLLTKSECPVMVAPHQAHAIKKIFFAYDGSASALFAIKQFTYLLPELKDAEVIVLEASEDAVFDEDQKEKLYGYLKEHYSRINFKDLHGSPKDELFDYTLREINACLVMGAYGRSWLSNLFKASTADLVIKLNNLPLFVTHW